MQTDVRPAVVAMLDEMPRYGGAAAIRFARDLDHWQGDILVLPEARAATAGQPQVTVTFAGHYISGGRYSDIARVRTH